MSAIPPPDAARLRSMLALAESNANPADGERLAAIAAAERLLQRHGLALRDLPALVGAPAPAAPAPRPHWRTVIQECLRRTPMLTPWETKFLASVSSFRRPTPRQIDVLNALAARLGVTEATP